MIRDMGINEQCMLVHAWSRSKGFWDHQTLHVDVDGIIGALTKQPGGVDIPNPSIWGEKRDLMHSEIAEMTEADRDGNLEAEQEECVDLLIRLMDYSAARGFDLGGGYVAKMKKNEKRPHLHGRRF